MAGRKAKLSDDKWVEIARRRITGETCEALAKEFGVSASLISANAKKHAEIIETTSNQIVSAQIALKQLPISAQTQVNLHVANLMALHSELGAAGIAGAKVSRRINEAISKRVARLHDDQLLDESELKTIMQSATASNASAKQGMDMLNLSSKPNGIPAQDDESEDIRVIQLVAPK